MFADHLLGGQGLRSQGRSSEGVEGVFTGPWELLMWFRGIGALWPVVLGPWTCSRRGRLGLCTFPGSTPEKPWVRPWSLPVPATRRRFEHVGDAASGSQDPEVMLHGPMAEEEMISYHRGTKSFFITEDKVPSPICCQGRRLRGRVPESSGDSF